MAQKTPQIVSFGSGTLSNTYYPIVMANGTGSGTEIDVQFRVSKPGTFSNLSALVGTANASGDTTIRFRKNGADGNQTVTIPQSSTAGVEDTTNTDSVASGDLVNVSISYTAGSIALSSMTILFEADDGTTTQFLMTIGFPAGFTNNNTTRYHTPVGNIITTNFTSEVQAANLIQHDMVASDFAVYIPTNARTTNTTFRVRKNSANQSQVVTFGSTVTGLIVDTTNTDSFSVNDVLNFSTTTAGGGNGISIRNMQLTLTSDVDGEMTLLANTSWTRSSTASDLFGSVVGALGAAADAEVFHRARLLRNAEASGLAIYISSNASNRDVNVHLRVNGSNGNNTFLNSAGTTGWFQDTTNSDSISDTQNINFRSLAVSAGTGNTSYTLISLKLTLEEIATLKIISSGWWGI